LSLNKDLDLARMQPMQQIVRGTLVGQRFILFLLGGFAVSATVLAVLGIFCLSGCFSKAQLVVSKHGSTAFSEEFA
jgi:hypothetical protein